jgi:CHAT domain-containing protein
VTPLAPLHLAWALALLLPAASVAEEGKAAGDLDALIRRSQEQLAAGALAEADATVTTLLPLAERLGTPAQQAAALAAAGGVRLARGDNPQAERLLQEALSRALQSGEQVLAATVELNLASLEAQRPDPAPALHMLRSAAERAETAGQPALAARALANAARLRAYAGEGEAALALIERSDALLVSSDASEAAAVLRVHLAVTLREVARRDAPRAATCRARALELLEAARTGAEASGDARATSDALGYLAALYEDEGRLEEALSLTRRALLAATPVDAPDSTYRWQWQSGRLLAALGREAEAIAAYEGAVTRLAALSPGALGTRPRGTAFEETVAPVYLGLVDLLLRRAPGAVPPSEATALRRRARDLVEQSKAAELRDYFRDDCVDAMRERVRGAGEVSGSAAVVHAILLDDRLELLVETRAGGLRQHTVEVPRAVLEAELHDFRDQLVRRTTRQYLKPARRLHGWLVAPWQDEVAALGVDTLVFVPDGLLRTVPMAALHDGETFLVERFAVAVTPGLELTDPRPLRAAQLGVLVGGLSQSVDGLPALTHAGEEVAAVHEILGGTVLLDESFQKQALERALATEDYGIVHVASHGQFTAEFEQSYLVAWDGKFSGDELAGAIGLFRFRDTPLELLTLSACETARGGDRAALGLLGIAVKSGARGAVGSLWKVNDASTARLMQSFYAALREDGVSRAQALRRAQRALLADPAFAHPLHWSGFLLIGSWL